MAEKLRVLVIGGSESNRRRVPSVGLEENTQWAEIVDTRNEVRGYWPAFLMHYLDARASGSELPEIDSLSGFGKGHYLYDRSSAYEWESAILWNVAMPATNAIFGLDFLIHHKERFRAFSPDIIVFCLGSVDCMEIDIERTAQDIQEPGPVSGLGDDMKMTYPHCVIAEEFRVVMENISKTVSWISNGARVCQLDIIGGALKSANYAQRVRAFSRVVQNNCLKFGFEFIRLPYLENASGDEVFNWLHKVDNHPNDKMNEAIAVSILPFVPDSRHFTGPQNEIPVPAIKVSSLGNEK